MFKNGFAYRLAKPEELPAVAKLHEQVFGGESYSADRFLAIAQSEGTSVLVAAFRSRIVGYALVEEVRALDGDGTDLNVVYTGVASGQRRRGHCSTLLDITKQWLGEKGFGCIYLEVEFNDRGASKCYAANGFVPDRKCADFMYFPGKPSQSS